MNSSTMGRLLTSKLREHALILRHFVAANSSSIPAVKAKMLQEIHLILTLMLGPPPSPHKEFTWEYYDSDSKFHSLTTTPVDFASSLSSPTAIRANAGSDVNSLFSLVNDPRNEYTKLLTVDRLGNVREGRPITYVNVPVATLKAAAISMLRTGLPVFFGCDVGKYSNSASGIMDTALFDYEVAFNVKLGMDKNQRLRTGESAMTHAMVFTGAHIVDGQAVRWRVQNSWGEAAGDKGFFVMSDEWFSEFVYQVRLSSAPVPSLQFFNSLMQMSERFADQYLNSGCGRSPLRRQGHPRRAKAGSNCVRRTPYPCFQPKCVLTIRQSTSLGPHGCFGVGEDQQQPKYYSASSISCHGEP